MPQATFGYDANGNLVPTITGAPEAAPLAPPPAAPPPAPAAGATPVLPPPVPGAPPPAIDQATAEATGAPAPATPLPPAAAAALGKIDQFHTSAPKPPPRPTPGSNLPIASTSTQLGADPAKTAERIARLDESTQAQVEQALRTGEAQQQRAVAGAEAKDEAATRAKQDAQVEQLDAQLQRRAANRKLSETLLEKDPEVQPNRLIEQMSTGKQIGMVLLAALSGGFAKVNGSGDPAAGALGVIQTAIDRDIAAQRAQIESGRIRRGNLISYYQQQGMDAKQAEQAARITIGNATAAQAEAQAQKLGAPAALENAQLLATKLRGDATAKAVELDASTDARTVVNRQAPQPVAPAASAKDIAEQMIAMRDINQLQRSGLKQTEYDAQAQKISESAQKAADYRSAVEDLAKEVGVTLQRNPDGTVTATPVDGSEAYSGSAVWDRSKRAAVDRKYARLKRADVMGMLREPSAELQNQFSETSDRPFNDANIADQVKFFAELAYQAERDAVSGYNPVVVQDYQRTIGGSAAGTGTGGSAPGPTTTPSLAPRGRAPIGMRPGSEPR